MPLVSIITALHNKEAYVADTIGSVLAQSLPDWELIVVENGSTDNGPVIVRQFSDPRIRLVISPRQGPGAARNFGLRLATGEWILFLDADDLIEPDYLADALNSGNAAKADIIVCHWRNFIDSPAEETPPEHPSSEGRTHAELLDSAIAFTPWILHAAFVRRGSLPRESWWPEHMDAHLGEDTVFWFRLLLGTSKWVSSRAAGALYRWKTPGCRTKNEDAAYWFNGLHQGACENLGHLADRGRSPTAGQAESLMRQYEGLYQLARRTGNRSVEDRSLRLARKWLVRSLARRWTHPGLVARLLLGFRSIDFITRCVRSQG